MHASPLQITFLVAGAAALTLLWVFDVIRPGSLTRAGARSVAGQPAWVWFASALLVYLSMGVGAGLGTLLPTGIAGEPGSLQRDAVSGLASSGVAVVVALLQIRLLSQAASGSGLALSVQDAPLGVGCFLVAAPVLLAAQAAASILHDALSAAPPDRIAHALLDRIVDNASSVWAWILAALAIVAAPLVEETIYRGLVQSSVLRLTSRPWAAVAITSAVFALAHRLNAAPVPWHAVGVLFVLGLALGLAMERTKRLMVPVAMHALFNALNVALAVLG